MGANNRRERSGANGPALGILRRGDGLRDDDGVLDAWLPADRTRLRRLVARALPSLRGEEPRPAVR
ncbi:MAG: hypothetical protein F4X36_07935 [Gammaproteobacteria bacterium]|nr:hypothetical protein [Gammaproteobacteria bacterium]